MGTAKDSFSKETKALATVLGVLEGLTAAQRRFVLRSAAERLNVDGIEATLTHAEKKKAGWYSEHQAFGPRNVDC